MHIIIINASPNSGKSGLTVQIVNAFQKGVLDEGGTVEVYSLSDRSQWDKAMQAVVSNDNIVFAVPVYAGIVTSIQKEFLEKMNDVLPAENRIKKRISFILQSSMPKATERYCCVKYLKSFVEHLHCDFAGVLSHSVFYGFIDNTANNLSESYYSFGKKYVKNNATFFFQEAIDFDTVEFLTEEQAKKFIRNFNFMCKLTAETIGGAVDLFYNPYEK